MQTQKIQNFKILLNYRLETNLMLLIITSTILHL
jgi:hypothetical protein